VLKSRIITAAILIPCVIGLIFFASPILFAAVSLALLALLAWEYTRLMAVPHKIFTLLYVAVLSAIAVGFYLAPSLYTLIFLGIAALWWGFATVLVILYPRITQHYWPIFWVRALLGGVMLLPAWLALQQIFQQPHGAWWMLCLMLLVWGADTAAYFVGRQWGKHKLAPRVSPGKSWEGLSGALLCGMLLAAIAGVFLAMPPRIILVAVLLSLPLVAISVVGDLTISMLKRQQGVKDTGQILPGHGGLLDRMDSLLSTSVFFALILQFIG
jgi:phosphatidate cytidylyltransferase